MTEGVELPHYVDFGTEASVTPAPSLFGSPPRGAGKPTLGSEALRSAKKLALATPNALKRVGLFIGRAAAFVVGVPLFTAVMAASFSLMIVSMAPLAPALLYWTAERFIASVHDTATTDSSFSEALKNNFLEQSDYSTPTKILGGFGLFVSIIPGSILGAIIQPAIVISCVPHLGLLLTDIAFSGHPQHKEIREKLQTIANLSIHFAALIYDKNVTMNDGRADIF